MSPQSGYMDSAPGPTALLDATPRTALYRAFRRRSQLLVDWLKTQQIVGDMAALFMLLWGVASASTHRKYSLFTTAARHARSSPVRSVLQQQLAPFQKAPCPRIASRTATAVGYTLIVKAPAADGEKGILFSTEEGAWEVIACSPHARSLFDRYTFVGVSAWSPPDYKKFIAFAGLSTSPINICVSNRRDLADYKVLAPLIAPLPMMASDWLNPLDFTPEPHNDRDIDIIMVAGWGRYKRHWLLFEALRRMSHNLRIVLVGSDSAGRTADDVSAEAKDFRLRQSVEIHSNLGVHDVHRLLARSRIKVLCSAREGACVAVAEAMFCGTPVAMLADAHVGSKVHINPATGVLLRRKTMAAQLEELIERTTDMDPRGWAMQNISCHHSLLQLTRHLRQEAAVRGAPWTTAIAPVFWRYFTPYYCDASDQERLADAYSAFSAEYGLKLVNGIGGGE